MRHGAQSLDNFEGVDDHSSDHASDATGHQSCAGIQRATGDETESNYLKIPFHILVDQELMQCEWAAAVGGGGGWWEVDGPCVCLCVKERESLWYRWVGVVGEWEWSVGGSGRWVGVVGGWKWLVGGEWLVDMGALEVQHLRPTRRGDLQTIGTCAASSASSRVQPIRLSTKHSWVHATGLGGPRRLLSAIATF